VHDPLSATFKADRGIGNRIVTIDDALDVIDIKNRSKANSVRKAKERGQLTLQQQLNLAKGRTAMKTKRGTIKMPQISFLQHDDDEDGT
jgi:hypothetical protein